MLDTILLPCLAALSFCWSAINAVSRRTATAAGAATLAGLTGLGWLARHLNLSAWNEGGIGMPILTIVGGYALGSAVAHRLSHSAGALRATIIGAVMTLLLAVGFHQDAVSTPEEFLAGTDPQTRELILTAARGEAARLLQLATGLLVAIGLTFVKPPRSRSEQLTAEAERWRSASSQSA